MSPQTKLNGRYELKEILGQGGMGVVYKAYDLVVKRDVALKTLRGIPGRKSLQLFQKECEVLASLSHPNIVEIFDIGEFEEQGEQKPFFVMPLLPGMPLDKLIHSSSQLSVERSVEIIGQTCRGLHAAHERGLVHRDLKPSNIFVMKDDSVKIIDFGVALMVDSSVTRGQKGTLLYMAPEQIEVKPLSALSDIFSLGVVCYETFTGRRPFERSTEAEVADAILHQIPPPISEFNPAISQNLSRVIHKAMAKQPWHRFTSAREFAETLGKALRNESIEFFDPSRIQPRIQRARKAFDQADYQFAGEILSELEAEGHIDTEISQLRRQIDQAERQKKVRQLLESARTRFEEDEYPLALQKIQEILQLDPENAAALGLKSTIENKRLDRKIEDWFRLAHQHISNHAYSHARQALQNVLQLRPKESKALQLVSEVDRREQQYLALRQEKEQAYKAALEAWQNGEISSALSKMGVVIELERQSTDATSPDRTATYQNFYNQVRSEHDAMNNAHLETRKHLADRDFAKALALCDAYLAKYPGNALFQALRFDVEEHQRQEQSAFVAEIDRRAEAEPDLGKRVSILEEALNHYPGEAHFEKSLRLMREKRDLVNSIAARARLYEERSQFVEALGQWEILSTIYKQFPGLDYEMERVVKRREQQARIESRARFIKSIEEQLHWSDFVRAIELAKEAQAEFPDDAELAELEKLAHQSMERAAQVQSLLAQGQEICAQHRFEEGVEILGKAYELDKQNALTRAALSDALAEKARGIIDADWRSADALIEQALGIDPGHALANSLRTLVSDHKREEFVDQCLSQARQLQSAGNLEGARAQLERGLSSYPLEPRLTQRHTALMKELLEGERQQTRRRDLEELRGLDRNIEPTGDPAAVEAMTVRFETIVQRYADDPEFKFLASSVGRRLETMTRRVEMQTRGGAFGTATRLARTVQTPAPAKAPHQELPTPHVTPPVNVVPGQAPVRPVAADSTSEPKKKPRWILVAAGAAAITIVGVSGVAWYLHHRQSDQISQTVPSPAPALQPQTPAPTQAPETTHPTTAAPAATPQTAPPTSTPEATLPSPEPPALAGPPKGAANPKKNKQPKLPKPAAEAAPAQPAAADSRLTKIANFNQLAYDAYMKGKYVEPEGESAIAYAKQALGLDHDDAYPKEIAYAKGIIESSVSRGTLFAQQAVKAKDFAAAHRLANALAQLLPGRNDIAELQKDIAKAEETNQPATYKEPTPVLSFRVHHKHTVGSCVGSLTIGKGRVGYRSENGKETFDFLLSEIMKPEKALGGGFFFTAKDGKRYFFDSPPAALAALQQAMGKN